MLGRLIKDESGIAMGLAVIVVLLVGVMGAGLLVFVRNDLEAVVEVNQGQQAFDAADAGVQAAKRELLSDACPESYDDSDASEGECEESEWSYWSEAEGEDYEGKELEFDGQQVEVEIRYLKPADPNQTDEEGFTPVVEDDIPEGRDYFEIESAGNSENGDARRKVEAIYYTSKLNVPTAYYTPESIEFSGTVDISGVSFFARENIYISDKIREDIDRSVSTIYGDWDTSKFEPPSTYNTVPREDELGGSVTGAGLAAEKLICAKETNCSIPADSVADGIYDYDSTTEKEFIRKDPPDDPSQLASQISYPFPATSNINNLLNTGFLREEAKRQGNYYGTQKDIDTTNNPTKVAYPTNSTDRTVFFVNGEDGDVDYNVPESTKARGTIVVENGNLNVGGSSSFNGVIIITGDGTNTGLYKSAGTPDIKGFVISDGRMTIRGSVTSFTVTEDFTNRPGFYGVRQWSWRECYSESCS